MRTSSKFAAIVPDSVSLADTQSRPPSRPPVIAHFRRLLRTPTPTHPAPHAGTDSALLPRKPVEMGKMFNGITFKTKFSTPESEDLASLDRTEDDSFEVEITFTAKLPRPSTTIEDIASNDPKLPHGPEQDARSRWPSLPRVSPFFERLYKIKIATIRDQLFSLDEVLSRHNFYDCETILELKSADTNRKGTPDRR